MEAPQINVGTQTQFARAQDWPKSYVTRLKQAGRLVLDDDGLVVFDASLARIKATSAAPARAAPAVQGPDYAEAQNRERWYSAELKRLDLERETGKLRDAAEVAAAVQDAGALIRVTVERWPHQLVPQLIAMGGDEARMTALLVAECEALLRRMVERIAALEGAA